MPLLNDDFKKKLQGRALKPPVIDLDALEAEVLEGLPEHSCAAWHRLCEEDGNAGVWFGEYAEEKEHELVEHFRSEVLDTLHRTARLEAGLAIRPQDKRQEDFEPETLSDALRHRLDKYAALVWYARKPNPANKEAWAKFSTNDEIKQGALNEMARVEEMFPEEVTSLKRPPAGDWQHGFNSGVLAALRLVMTAASEGPETAEEFWPELDT